MVIIETQKIFARDVMTLSGSFLTMFLCGNIVAELNISSNDRRFSQHCVSNCPWPSFSVLQLQVLPIRVETIFPSRSETTYNGSQKSTVMWWHTIRAEFSELFFCSCVGAIIHRLRLVVSLSQLVFHTSHNFRCWYCTDTLSWTDRGVYSTEDSLRFFWCPRTTRRPVLSGLHFLPHISWQVWRVPLVSTRTNCWRNCRDNTNWWKRAISPSTLSFECKSYVRQTKEPSDTCLDEQIRSSINPWRWSRTRTKCTTRGCRTKGNQHHTLQWWNKCKEKTAWELNLEWNPKVRLFPPSHFLRVLLSQFCFFPSSKPPATRDRLQDVSWYHSRVTMHNFSHFFLSREGCKYFSVIQRLLNSIHDLQSEYKRHKHSPPKSVRNVSPVIHHVLWTQSLQSHMQSIIDHCKSMSQYLQSSQLFRNLFTTPLLWRCVSNLTRELNNSFEIPKAFNEQVF